jgi:hypothetical protein
MRVFGLIRSHFTEQIPLSGVLNSGATKEELGGPDFYLVGGPKSKARIFESFILTTCLGLPNLCAKSYVFLAGVRGRPV